MENLPAPLGRSGVVRCAARLLVSGRFSNSNAIGIRSILNFIFEHRQEHCENVENQFYMNVLAENEDRPLAAFTLRQHNVDIIREMLRMLTTAK